MTCAQWPCRGEDQSNEKKGMENDTHHMDVSHLSIRIGMDAQSCMFFILNVSYNLGHLSI